MNFLLGIAGALASLFIFFFSASRIATDQSNFFLTMTGLFLFLYFAWGSVVVIHEEYYVKRKRNKRQ